MSGEGGIRNKSSKQKQQNIYEGAFDYNSPRPPVPGEEKTGLGLDWGQMEWNRYKVSSSPTPKKYTIDASASYETDINCKSNSRPSSRHDRPYNDVRSPCDNFTPPACLRWAQSLHRLLEDPDGVELFRKYLQSEGKTHSDALDFWFACEGLKKQHEPERVQQLVKVIYK